MAIVELNVVADNRTVVVSWSGFITDSYKMIAGHGTAGVSFEDLVCSGNISAKRCWTRDRLSMYLMWTATWMMHHW